MGKRTKIDLRCGHCGHEFYPEREHVTIDARTGAMVRFQLNSDGNLEIDYVDLEIALHCPECGEEMYEGCVSPIVVIERV